MNLQNILELHKKWLNNGASGIRADLRGADLREAILYGADLRRANLYGVILRGANLHEAILYGADLYGANLTNTPIISFSGTRHFAYSFNGRIKIGCKDLTISEWLEQVDIIGESQGYTSREIKIYKRFINNCAEDQND